MPGSTLPQICLDQLFNDARTYPTWQERPVTEDTLRALFDLMKWAPTSMNCWPARLVMLRTDEAKQRLIPALMGGNVSKVETAPVTVIVAADTAFQNHLAERWPHDPSARELFDNNPTLAESTWFRNSTLQGAYVILAARALGLDCGPMSGFDNAAVDAEFFPEGRYRSNFLINLGYGDVSGLHPRSPRPAFEEVVTLL